jgi:predicted transcriptional regulator
VPIKRSVKPDYIVCLEDGKKLKMLKRHLRTAFGLSPQEYRAKWSLPQDYPMVAPKYAKRRSELAKKIGLGRKPGERPKARKPAARTTRSRTVGMPSGRWPPPVQSREPAVPIKRSVKPDYIVCLEDGKKLKMLKRHLRTAFGLSPQEYRAKWRLPYDYPMVAPKYAKRRSELAKEIGLGRKPGERPKAREQAAS